MIRQIEDIDFNLISRENELPLSDSEAIANYNLLNVLAESLAQEYSGEIIPYGNRSFGVRFPGRKIPDIGVSADHGVIKAYDSQFVNFANQLAQVYRASTAYLTSLDRRNYFNKENVA